MQRPLLTWIVIVLCLSLGQPVLAQGGGDAECPAVVEAALDMTLDYCENIVRNEACYGHVQVLGTPHLDVTDFVFAQAGDVEGVDRIERIQLGGMDVLTRTWGVGMLRLQANLPDTLPGQAVTLVLFGDVTVTDAVEPVPTLAVSAATGINVRQIPSTTGQLIGSLAAQDVVEANGRTEDATWLRIGLPDERMGWVYRDLLQSDGDILALDVTGESDAAPASYTPMQAFFVETGWGPSTCAEAPHDGILIQTPEHSDAVALVVNEAEVVLGSTVYIQAVRDGELIVRVVEGYARITAAGETRIAPAGTQIRVPLDELSAAGPPSEPEPYALADVAALPIRLTERAITIADPLAEADIEAAVLAITAVAATPTTCAIVPINDANLRGGPGTNYYLTGVLPAGQAATPLGYRFADGYRWWQLSEDEWIRADLVTTTGDCTALTSVAAPTPPPDPIVISNQTCGWETVHVGDPVFFLTGTHRWSTQEEAEAAFSGLMPSMTLDGVPLTNITLDGVSREQSTYGQNARAFWIATPGTHTYVGQWPIDSGSDTCTFTVVD